MIRRVFLALKMGVAAPTFLLFTIGISFVFIVLMLLRQHRMAEAAIRLWSRLFLSIPPVRLEVEGRENVVPGNQYVFLANHLSNLDIPALFLAIPTPIRYLAKKEVYRIPIFAQALKIGGIVKIDRGAGAATYQAINEGVARAKERGYSLIIFAEGTRARGRDLAPFKKGAFRIAIMTGLPVVPVTIHGTWEAWPPGSKLIYPHDAKVIIDAPIPTEGLDPADISDLRDRVQGVIDARYREMLATE
jgi:1-acyl-sn-glycerol-3-phosphate acyltransferase